MKIVQRFKVVYNPEKLMNAIMRNCDFFSEGEGIAVEEIFVITWKEGEIVDKARIDKAVEYIRQALEMNGCEVFKVEVI